MTVHGPPARPDVAIVHDYLTQRGGAERVVLDLLAAFPGAPLYTSVYARNSTFPEFRSRPIATSFLQKFPAVRRDPRVALALLPKAFDTLDVGRPDIVVCSSSGFAHGVRAESPKLVYCHNTPRWLYQPEAYLADRGPASQAAVRLLAPNLRRWDLRAARSATRYVANSAAVAARIEAAYGIRAAVINPPRGVSPDGPRQQIDGIEPGYLLTVGRPRGYKHMDLIAAAVQSLPGQRVVCAGGAPAGDWPGGSVTSLTGLSDAQLRWLYENCRALVSCSEEDFGLTPVEAFSFGKPALLLRFGGHLETHVEGMTGEMIESASVEAVRSALQGFDSNRYDAEVIRTHAQAWSPKLFHGRLASVVNELLDDAGAA